jgi:Immunity protein 26
MAKRQQRTVGSILEINIDKQYYVYGQILKEGYAFFDYKSKEPLTDFAVLLKAPILFILGVYNYVVTKGEWLKVGKLDIREDLKVRPMNFIQDALNPKNFELYDPNTGEIRPCKREECEGLEPAAVWAANHVESRIRDYYNGVPNVWVERLKIKD